ncbi:unnamed protein product [Gongylonema pulchrum]|uniref:ZP domain-containing protein n=1 Tax=Gongylonema pulchrum TaxID=637853 RepID=A0A183F1K4_9BILA|nr:unnamed protein product [Gongylonema pulchrum]
MVSLTFKTRKPFTGRVYVRGLADDDRCSRNFASNVDQNKFSMMIQNGDCTMQRQRVTGSLERLTSGIDMSPVGTTELLDTARTPTCTYSIHSGSADGPPVS